MESLSAFFRPSVENSASVQRRPANRAKIVPHEQVLDRPRPFSCDHVVPVCRDSLPYPGYARSEAQSGSMVEVTPVLREFSVLPDTTFLSTWSESGRRGGFGKEERSRNSYSTF